MDGKILNIVTLLVGLIVSVGFAYLTEKNLIFLVFAVLSGFCTVILIAYQMEKNPQKKDHFSWAFLFIIPLVLCGFLYYTMNKALSEKTSPPVDKADESYEQETLNAAQTINDYHKFFNNKNCSDAYNLLTARYRSVNAERLGTVEKFEKTCLNSTNLEVSNLSAPTQNIRRFITLVSWKQNGTPMKEDVLWGMEKQGGKWLIDTKLKVIDKQK